MKIGIISILPFIEKPESYTFNDLYNAIGLNTGNLMFTNAVTKQIKGDIERIGFNFSTDYVNRNFDSLVIPAANWINSYLDWEWFNDILEKIRIPVITIGIGVQADTNFLRSIKVNSSCMRLAKLLSNKSKYISVRGDLSRDWFIKNGMKNVITTGCPSLYMKLDNKLANSFKKGIVVQSTRYYMDESFLNDHNLNSALYRIAGDNKFDFVYQSEPEEINFLVYGDSIDKTSLKFNKSLVNLYGFNNESKLKSYLQKHGQVFFSIDDWANYLSGKSCLIGTRLHGTIVALNIGTPTALIPHDSRTQEIAEFASIPTIDFKTIKDIIKTGNILEHIESIDKGEYLNTRSANSKIYQEFLYANDLEFKKEELLS